MVQSALHQGLRGGRAVLCQDVLFQGAGVDPDADGDVLLAAGVGHGFHPAVVPDVAGIDADFIDARGHGLQGQLVVKVDVRHQGDGHLLLDGGDEGHGLFVGDGRPQDLAPCPLQAQGLLHAALDVCGGHVEHGLHGDGRAASNGHAPGHHLF